MVWTSFVTLLPITCGSIELSTELKNFETILVGEIRPMLCGTRFSAKGNHYYGSLINLSLIEDKTRIKSIFALGKPSDASEDFANLWDNQLVTLCKVVQQDWKESPGKNIHIKDWTTHADSGTTGDPDYIVVVTDPMYTAVGGWTVKQSNLKGRMKKKVLTEQSTPTNGSSSKVQDGVNAEEMDIGLGELYDMATAGAEPFADETTNQVTTNNLYPPSVLPDYGGDLFKHVNVKLRQLDFININNNLILP
ncbi:hypothetical protein OG21DRAFT_1481240 [Imleria badia]|nr:hypothetical protein OG21DRAFT_1481240 [Imleria badia]